MYGWSTVPTNIHNNNGGVSNRCGGYSRKSVMVHFFCAKAQLVVCGDKTARQFHPQALSNSDESRVLATIKKWNKSHESGNNHLLWGSEIISTYVNWYKISRVNSLSPTNTRGLPTSVKMWCLWVRRKERREREKEGGKKEKKGKREKKERGEKEKSRCYCM